MSYDLVILPAAQQEIEDAFEYYAQFSLSAVAHFDDELEHIYQNLEMNPFFQVRHNGLRALPFGTLPFIMFFNIDEKSNIVYIYSVFNTYQDPDKYPSY